MSSAESTARRVDVCKIVFVMTASMRLAWVCTGNLPEAPPVRAEDWLGLQIRGHPHETPQRRFVHESA
jgi:hypothetical protein